jgi:hypothetical protein
MEDRNKDDWDEVIDFPDYELSYAGVLRSKVTGRIVLPSENDTGAYKVNIRRGGRNYVRSLGRLVCRQFHGEPAYGDVVIYEDEDNHNVNGDNLRWASRSFAWDWVRQAKRSRPLRAGPIQNLNTGAIYPDSLSAARAIRGIEKYVVLAAADPINRSYRGVHFQWVVRPF